MNIHDLTNRLTEIETGQPAIKRYINESVYNSPEMAPHWKRLDEGFLKGYSTYLSEVALAPDQIQSIFKAAAGGGAGAAPKDPGMLSKIVDKVLPVSQAGSLEQNLPEPDAGPVDGFEQKAAAAVQALPGADSATKQSLMQWIKQGVSKPETQQLILAAVGGGLSGVLGKIGPLLNMIPGGGTAIAAITGAVIAGGVSIAAAKMQGKDWKTAFKGAIKPALMGGASAVIGSFAADAVSSAVGAIGGAIAGKGQDAASAKFDKGMADAKAKIDAAGGDGDTSNFTGTKVAGEPVIPGEPLTPRQMAVVDMSKEMGNTPSPQVQAAYDLAKQSAKPGGDTANLSQDQVAAMGGGDNPLGITARPSINNVDQPGSVDLPSSTTDVPINRLTGKPFTNIKEPSWTEMSPDQQAAFTLKQQAQAADAAQATQNAKDYWANKSPLTRGLKESFAKSKYVDKQATLQNWFIQESRGQVIYGLKLKPIVKEGIMDWFKGKSKDEAGGVTPEALNQAWVAAKSPTDSEAVAKVLQDAGVKPDVVNKVFADLKIPAPTGQPAPEADPAAAPKTDPAAAGQPDELDAVKKNAGLPVVNIKDMLTKILALTPEEQQQVLAYLKK